MKEYVVCHGNVQRYFKIRKKSDRVCIRTSAGTMESLAKVDGPKARGYSRHSFSNCWEERNIKPVLADIDRVIIMERVKR